MRLAPRVAAILGFAGLSVLCGVAVHLVAELAALGWAADARVVLSSRHIPLAFAAIAAVIAVGIAGLPAGLGRAQRIAAVVRAFPVKGTGIRFFAIAAIAQLAVFGITEAGEGTLGPDDLWHALIAALCASTIGAILVARCKTRVIEALAELFTFILTTSDVGSAAVASWRRIDAHVRVWRARALTFAASLRPPPTPAVTVRFSLGFAQEYRGVHIRFGAHHRAVCGIEPCARRFSTASV